MGPVRLSLGWALSGWVLPKNMEDRPSEIDICLNKNNSKLITISPDELGLLARSGYKKTKQKNKHTLSVALNKKKKTDQLSHVSIFWSNIVFRLKTTLDQVFFDQLLKERICSLWSKFFSLRVDLILKDLWCPKKQTGKHKSCSPWYEWQKNMEVFPYTLKHTEGCTCTCQHKRYRIYLAIRRGFPSLEWVQIIKSALCNFAVIRVLPLLNNPKDLDPSCKTNLDFWDCFGRKKTPSYKRRNTVSLSI